MFHADKTEGCKKSQLLGGGHYLFPQLRRIYCAEVTPQSVPRISKKTRDLLSKLFKTCKLIALITSIIHENSILQVFLNKDKSCMQSSDNCSVSVYLFIANKSTIQDTVCTAQGKLDVTHTFSSGILKWVIRRHISWPPLFFPGSTDLPTGAFTTLSRVSTTLNLRQENYSALIGWRIGIPIAFL